MNNKFIEVMKTRSDLQLVEIVEFDKHLYIPEAINAVRDEIKLRNLKIDVIKSEIEEIRRETSKRKSNKPLNRTYIYILLILFFPILLLIISFFKEEIFNVFLLPIIIISFLPCGLIGTILAKKENNKFINHDVGFNYTIGVIEIIFGVLMTLVGFLGICLIIALV